MEWSSEECVSSDKFCRSPPSAGQLAKHLHPPQSPISFHVSSLSHSILCDSLNTNGGGDKTNLHCLWQRQPYSLSSKVKFNKPVLHTVKTYKFPVAIRMLCLVIFLRTYFWQKVLKLYVWDNKLRSKADIC